MSAEEVVDYKNEEQQIETLRKEETAPPKEDSPTELPLQTINLSDYTKWTVNDVVQWCILSLEIAEMDRLCQNIRLNDITGDLLPELSLNDCKYLCHEAERELTKNGLQKAIKLKIMINKLKDNNVNTDNVSTTDRERLQQQEENMTLVLNNLYSTVTTKLQDYQSQYQQLRMDILDLVKNTDTNNNNEETTLRPKIRRSTSSRRNQSRSTESSIPTLAQRRTESTNSIDVPHSPSKNSFNSTNLAPTPTNVNAASPTHNEALKQLRASKDDSSEKILKSAMRRHNLNDKDWRQYVLVIGYGDQERILEAHENPVVVFKNLKQQGLHPTIMLRRRGDFEELQSNDMLGRGDGVTPGGRL